LKRENTAANSKNKLFLEKIQVQHLLTSPFTGPVGNGRRKPAKAKKNQTAKL
jgi:hypothetical protein